MNALPIFLPGQPQTTRACGQASSLAANRPSTTSYRARPGSLHRRGGLTVPLGLVVWGLASCLVPEIRVCADEGKPASAATVQSLLAKYCYECHGAKEQSGDRRFDLLALPVREDNALVDFQDILDQLNLSEMPPAEAPQPSDAERLQVIHALTQEIATYHRQRQAPRSEVVLRRLNSREYRHTIRDLFDLEILIFDPTEKFPRDQQLHHLDNVGETLVTSGYLLAQYLSAAEAIVDKAMYPLQKPAVQTWSFTDNLHQQPEIDQVHRKTNHYTYLTLYDVIGADKHEGAYAPIHDFAAGVPYDGFYDITFDATAVNREHPYEDEFLGTDRREPLRLGIVAGNQLAGPLHKPQPVEPLLAEIDLTDETRTYSLRIWLDRGFTPRFIFRNGLMDVRTLWSRIQKKYPDKFPKVGKGIVAARYNAIANGKLPQIHVDNIEISGPHYDQWPRQSQLALLGDDWTQVVETGQLPPPQLRQQLSRFLTRVYRRPVREAEIERILSLIASRRKAGRSLLDAYADGVKAALCSPNFLYWDEGNQRHLDSHALASRLSSFLWSSMPDDELAKCAASGELLETDRLQAEMSRMLQSEKSWALVDGFLDSWLTLRELGATPPDRNEFAAYYHYELGPAMREETRRFTHYLLQENLSIANFLHADFVFVNKRLAQHYGLTVPPEIQTNPFAFVKLQLDDQRRGGLLGQASVLTVTANGIDTSPVVRGVWLLENILGTPPSPPPPDVEPLDPDVRGATSIRDQLEKHRSVPSCYDCHRKIDPLGFALENFDPIGQWRDRYGKSVTIDAAGELPNGQTFSGIEELKPILLEQQQLFTRALTNKLLAYALGRQLEPADRPEVDRIVEAVEERGLGLRDLVERIVLSETFRSR